MSLSPSMPSADRVARARAIGLIVIVLGCILLVAGAATWVAIRAQLGSENIVLSDDAAMFAGQLVDDPVEAFLQADVIKRDAAQMSEGRTYADLDRDDPVRASVMTATFLRSSLLTSVIAFGMAGLSAGLGLIFLLVGGSMRLTPASHRDRAHHDRPVALA